MAVDEIVDKIISDAKKKAQRIKQEAKREARKILLEAEREAEELKKNYIVQAKKNTTAEAGRILTQARLENRKMLLSVKQQLIGEAFQLVEERLDKLPSNKKLDFIKRLVLLTTESGDEELIVSPENRRIIDQKFLKELNGMVKKEKGTGKIKLSSESRSVGIGIILKKGNLEINASMKNLLDEVRARAEGDIIRLLEGGK